MKPSYLLTAMAAAAALFGQTQIDLRTQSHNVDFTGAPYTRPVKTGVVLPSTCAQGDLFFLLTANAGQNLYGCAVANTWSQTAGQGALSIQSSGLAVGSASTLNAVAGTGFTCIPQVAGGVATIQCNADTSYVATKNGLQNSTNPQICISSSAKEVSFTASCATSLSAYVFPQTLFWYADVTNTSTSPTLNIDALGAIPLVRNDGSALAINDIRAGTLYRIWYDGAKMHVAETAAPTSSASVMAGAVGPAGSSLPVCVGSCLHMATDAGAFLSAFTGSSWLHSFRNLSGFNLVNLTGFTALNGARASQDGPFVNLTAAASTTSNPGILYAPLPATPYSVTACFQLNSNHPSQAAGLVLLSSVSNASSLTNFLGLFDRTDSQGNQISGSNQFFGLVREINQNMGGGGLVGALFSDYFGAGTPACVGVSDDGTTRKYAQSFDGVRWKPFYAQTHDSSFSWAGVFIDSDSSSAAFSASWIGWSTYATTLF